MQFGGFYTPIGCDVCGSRIGKDGVVFASDIRTCHKCRNFHKPLSWGIVKVKRR